MAVEDQLERLMSIQISNIGLENSQSVRWDCWDSMILFVNWSLNKLHSMPFVTRFACNRQMTTIYKRPLSGFVMTWCHAPISLKTKTQIPFEIMTLCNCRESGFKEIILEVSLVLNCSFWNSITFLLSEILGNPPWRVIQLWPHSLWGFVKVGANFNLIWV